MGPAPERNSEKYSGGAAPTRCRQRANGEATRASGAASARCGYLGDPPPMLSAVAQAALEGDLAAKVQALASDPKDDGLAVALARRWAGRSWPATREFSRNASRCGETLPRDKSHWQQTARPDRSKEGSCIEQEAAGGASAENQGPTVRHAIPGEVAAITRLHEVNPIKALLG
jgi:hypothetical protein